MKTAKYVFVAMGLVLLLSSCFMSSPWLAGGEGDSVYLPPDVIKDTTRSGSEPFQFETLLPVDLNLKIDFYELSTVGLDKSALEEISALAGQAVVIITNSKGDIVYEGTVQSDGSLNAQLVLPADPEDMTLTVKAYGFHDRSVKINDFVQYSKIDRELSLMSEGLSAKELGDPEEWDRDGDLVPDVYDAFPDDAEYAFALRFPPEEDEYYTVAYEDLYLEEDAGDADYNDFLVKYEIFELIKNNKELGNVLKEIRVEATAGAKIAGYNHLFGIAFGYIMEGMEEDFGGTFTLTYVDSSGVVQTVDHTGFYNAGGLVKVTPNPNSPFNYKAVMPMFGSTNAATSGPNNKAVLEVVLENSGIARDRIQLPPYDPFLYVWNTHHDIHLIGEQPLPSIPDLPGINPIVGPVGPDPSIPVDTYYLDEVGFPWALLVPVNWEHPPETVRIEKVYPFFTNWRLSEGSNNTDWYLRPMDPSNDPPGKPTVSPDTLTFDSTDFTEQVAYVDITLGTDPDGDDPVTLHSTAPAYITIDENGPGPESHKVIVDFPDDELDFEPPEKLNIYLWCEDAEGARSEFTQLNLKLVAPPERQRLIVETYPFLLGAPVTDTTLELYNAAGFVILDENNPGVPFDHFPSAMIDYLPAADLASGMVLYVKIYSASGNIGPYSIRAFYLGESAALPNDYDYSGFETNDPDLPYEDFEIALDSDPWNDTYVDVDPWDDIYTPGEGPFIIPFDSASALHRSLETSDDVDWIRIIIP